MSETVYITGMGMISAIGDNVQQNLESLKTSRTGVQDVTLLDTMHKGTLPAAEVKYSFQALCERAGVPPEDNYPRTSLLGILAGREALESAGITDVNAFRTGFISGTTVGGMDKSEELYIDLLGANNRTDLGNIISHDTGHATEKIADTLGLTYYLSTISTACSSAANAIMYGARLIKGGILDRVLVGGTDALTRFTLNGFNSLKILSNEWCRPFDAQRKGLNLGEGAAYLVLESEEMVKRFNKPVLATLSGYGNATDAYHQTASSPEGRGAQLAMKKALRLAGLKPADIGYINAHGTATPNNDVSEGTAISTIFGDEIPPVSSTKAFTGHTLGAAGGIEAVIAILALQNGMIFPNLNYDHPMEDEEVHFTPQATLMEGLEMKHVLSNSFGFGGNCSTLILSKS